MSPEDDSFEMNPNLERDVKRDLDAKAQRVVDGIAGEHTGEARADIRTALDRGLSEIGIPVPAVTLDEWSSIMARGDDVKVDIQFT